MSLITQFEMIMIDFIRKAPGIKSFGETLSTLLEKKVGFSGVLQLVSGAVNT